MKQPLVIVGAALIAALSLPAYAQQKPADTAPVTSTAPGATSVATRSTVSATVQAIDPKTRQVTLKGPYDRVITVTAGPEVTRLNEIKVGDTVVMNFSEALSLTLKKDGKELRSRRESAAPFRPVEGALPAGVTSSRVEIVADVIAVDATAQTVTLRGPKQTMELRVSDPDQFALIKVGDQIQAVYTEAVAYSIEHAKK